MPDMPQLKQYPYTTTRRCTVCHPADLEEPPFMRCFAEVKRGGTTVERQLECPNCGERDQDIYDTRTGRVTFDKALDIQAAKGLGKGGDVG